MNLIMVFTMISRTLMSAWIETIHMRFVLTKPLCRTLMSAWIETDGLLGMLYSRMVALS